MKRERRIPDPVVTCRDGKDEGRPKDDRPDDRRGKDDEPRDKKEVKKKKIAPSIVRVEIRDGGQWTDQALPDARQFINLANVNNLDADRQGRRVRYRVTFAGDPPYTGVFLLRQNTVLYRHLNAEAQRRPVYTVRINNNPPVQVNLNGYYAQFATNQQQLDIHVDLPASGNVQWTGIAAMQDQEPVLSPVVTAWRRIYLQQMAPNGVNAQDLIAPLNVLAQAENTGIQFEPVGQGITPMHAFDSSDDQDIQQHTHAAFLGTHPQTIVVAYCANLAAFRAQATVFQYGPQIGVNGQLGPITIPVITNQTDSIWNQDNIPWLLRAYVRTTGNVVAEYDIDVGDLTRVADHNNPQRMISVRFDRQTWFQGSLLRVVRQQGANVTFHLEYFAVDGFHGGRSVANLGVVLLPLNQNFETPMQQNELVATLLHELGHQMGMSPQGEVGPRPNWSGLEAGVNYYFRNGGHCGHRNPQNEPDCIMYGRMHNNFHLCADCQLDFARVDLSPGWTAP